MKLNNLYIEEFKNLKKFFIDFDQKSPITVIVGWNGTGKSNLFEALVIIFRDCILKKPTGFAYTLSYSCHGNNVLLKNSELIAKDGTSYEPKRFNLKVDISPITLSLDGERNGVKLSYLPEYIFGYYSGPSNRFKEHFASTQQRYYDRIIKADESSNLRELKSLRRMFYAENHHSKYVLMAFFLKDDNKIKGFLEHYLRIIGLESVLFIMKKPYWAKSKTKHFWGAKGLPRNFLNKLYNIALAPMRLKQSVPTGIKYSTKKELYYLYVKDVKSLIELAKEYETASDFFAALESTDLSEVIHDVRVNVKIRNHDGTITFRELSEGEQQLLVVLGLLRFTKEKESLILLDEPDTHLNPYWSIEYLNLLKTIVDDEQIEPETPEEETRHIVMATHDPLVISGLQKEQIQLFKRNKEDNCYTELPEMSPKGLGFTGILTSDMFGFRSDLDPGTLSDLDKKVELSGQENLSDEERLELKRINAELDKAGLLATFSDPYYSEFVKAWSRKTSLRRFEKPSLTRQERIDQAILTDEILQELLGED